MLSSRELKVTYKLLTAKNSTRIGDLSSSFNVSSRTIKYDLENVRNFLNKHEVTVYSKAGKGIWIEADDEKRKAILVSLESEGTYYDQSMRIQKALLILFVREGYVTAADLAEQLLVSRNTVLKDMRYIGKILEDNGLTLSRKKSSGYKILGDEHLLRDFFELHIQKCLSVRDVYLITNRIKSPGLSKKSIGDLSALFSDFYDAIEAEMIEIFEENAIVKLQNENIILMIIRLLITSVRLKKGQLIGDAACFSQGELSENYLYSYWASAFERLDLPVYKDELKYIEGVFSKNSDEVDLAGFTSALIKEVSERQAFPYHEDASLYTRLISHLTTSLSQDIMENPFNEVLLRAHYPLFQVIKEICRKHVKNSKILLNDSFITYIILHFLASKRSILSAMKVKAILICATGRGAVRLIKRIIESEVKDIEVVANCSLVEVEHVIKEIQPDILISVFPVESDLPTIVVDAIPSKENLEIIKETIASIKKIPSVSGDMENLLDFDSKSSNSEEVSQQIILKALEIYKQFEGYSIKRQLEFAFLSHILLFAHRYWFEKQYHNNKTLEGHESLKQIFRNMDIYISDAELEALLNYIE